VHGDPDGRRLRDIPTVTLDDVRRVLLALPETEEGLAWGTPTFRVRRKVIARMRELLVEAWRMAAPKRLREAFDAESPP
jgi:hypothetical protein